MSNEKKQEKQLKEDIAKDIAKLYKNFYEFAASILQTDKKLTDFVKKLFTSQGKKELQIGSLLYEEENVGALTKFITRRAGLLGKSNLPNQPDDVSSELEHLFDIILEPAKKKGKEEELKQLKKTSLYEAECLVKKLYNLAESRSDNKILLDERVKNLEKEIQVLKEKLNL